MGGSERRGIVIKSLYKYACVLLCLSVGACIVRDVGQAYALPERIQNDYVLQWFQPTD